MYSIRAYPTNNNISISIIFQNPSFVLFLVIRVWFFFLIYLTSAGISVALALCIKKHTYLHG